MREQPARMICWFTIPLSAIFLIVGCQSTGSPTTLKREAKASAAADGIAWRKSSPPSTAQTQDSWDNPPKDESVRSVGFRGQPEVGGEPAPIPEIMIKDAPDSKVVHGTPVAMRHGSRYSSTTIVPALPNTAC